MRLREATHADVPAIEAAYVRSWRAAYAGTLAPDRLDEEAEVRRRRHDWTAGIADPDGVVLVGVDDDDRVLGVVQAVLVLPPPRDLPEVLMLYVDPVAWGTGLATTLLAAAEGWIATWGHTEARLRVVADHHRARRFYEREGWVLDPGLPHGRTALATLVAYRRPLDPGRQASTANDPS